MTGAVYACIGALVGGMALVLAWARARAVRIDARIAPYVRPADVDAWARHANPRGAVATLVRAVVDDLVRLLARFGISSDAENRLLAAGSRTSPERYRVEQVLWGAVGLVAGVFLALTLALTRDASPLVLAILVVAMAAAGVASRDAALSWAVRRRRTRVLDELPAVAELLALAVTAGQALPQALERVVSATNGALAEELGAALDDHRSGVPLARALEAARGRVQVPVFARMLDAITTALELGTPLGEVLRAQAADARSARRERLMEEGGVREIGMLVPVVFLILPVTIAFAVFPGAIALRLTG